MTNRINRAIELLEADQPIYYVGHHTGHVLTYEQGLEDAGTWADYINVGMEHGAFDMTGLDAYMRGLVDGGPTRSGHRTPTVIVEAPMEAISEEMVRFNAWQLRQILARGVHGILLCQAESAGAVRAFVELCRYPVNTIGVGDGPNQGLSQGLNQGRRGVGSEPSAMPIWGVERDEYIRKADPWPLNREGELLLGLKIESAAAIPHIEEILSVPGIGFAEMGPGDLSLSLGYLRPPDPLPDVMLDVRRRVMAACKANNIAFLAGTSPEKVIGEIDAGVRVVGGHNEEAAKIGRKHTGRTMPV